MPYRIYFGRVITFSLHLIEVPRALQSLSNKFSRN